MNIFGFNKELESYKFPITRLIVSVLFIVCVLYISFQPIKNQYIGFIISFFCAAALIVCVLNIYLSWFEIVYVSENLRMAKLVATAKISDTKEFSIDKIVSLVKGCHIKKILIIASNEKVKKIGSISESDRGSFEFYNKRYYIDDKEYKQIEDFYNALIMIAVNNKVYVLEIDGSRQK